MLRRAAAIIVGFASLGIMEIGVSTALMIANYPVSGGLLVAAGLLVASTAACLGGLITALTIWR